MPPVVNTPEIRFDCEEERKFSIIDEVKQRLATNGAEVNTIDGVRVRTPDGWWLLRASNTQPALITRAEAGSPEGLERLKDEVRSTLRSVGLEAPTDF
jgi:phosphomannomutase